MIADENTMGSAAGGALDKVVTDGDILEVCRIIVGKRQASAKNLTAKLSWTPEKVNMALESMFAQDLLSSPFGNGSRYAVNEEKVVMFIDSHKNAVVVKKTKLAAPLAGIVPKPTKAAKASPRKSSTETLDDMLAEISAMPSKKIFEGAERESKIAETFERLVDVVEKLNKGLEGLDRVSEKVRFSRTPASIERVFPEGNGLGGVIITYRGFVKKEAWAPDMTQSWCDRKVEQIASWTKDKLYHAISVAKRG